MATTRNKVFKSPPPRLRHEGPSRFLQKLDPWFVGSAHFFKENIAPEVNGAKRAETAGSARIKSCSRPVKSPPAPLIPQWPRTVGEMLRLLTSCGDLRFAEGIKAMQQRIPTEALTTDLNRVLPNIFCLLKYQVTVPELDGREMQGDREAGRQVVETADLYNRWMHEQLPREGVQFKTNIRHNLLMLYGLAGGLERLTSRELGDFFDQFCPCGKTHTLEVLRRLRQKLVLVLERGAKAAE